MSDKKNMRIVFMGTPDFAVESLRYLVDDGWNIVGVITAPDRKAGRGQKLRVSAVKEYAQSKGLTILQPTNLKSEEFVSELKTLKADLQIVVAFRMLPEIVWAMPPLGTINLHASLLPDYRGAAPINWAIINREKITGLTTFFLQHQIDTGDILLQEEVIIEENDTAGSLHDKLMYKGGPLLVESLKVIAKGEYSLIKQDITNNELKQAPKIFSDDCEIDWNNTASETDAFIRGLSPYPAAWTMLEHQEDKDRKRLKVFGCKISENTATNKVATIEILGHQVFINTSDKKIELLDVQLEGKKRMSIRDLLNGFSLDEYYII